MAVTFNGSNQALNLGVDLNVLRNVAGGSMMGWSRPRIVPTGGNQFSMMAIAVGPPPGTTGNSRMSFLFNATTIQYAVRALDGDGASLLAPAITLVAGAWIHVAGTYNFTTRQQIIYVNGVQFAIQTGTTTVGNTSNTNSKNAAIGAADDTVGQNFDGDLEDWRVYERVVSPNEIQTIYTSCGKDGIWDSCRMRYMLQELGGGQAVVLAPDYGTLGRGAAPSNAPNYSGNSISVTRRKPVWPG